MREHAEILPSCAYDACRVLLSQLHIYNTITPLGICQQVPYHVCIVRGETDCESVGQLICQKADELKAALMAMAAHNKGRLVRFIVGSTTRYCIRHSHVTVLVMQNN